MYESPTTESRQIGTMSSGTPIKFIRVLDGGWSQVQVEGELGSGPFPITGFMRTIGLDVPGVFRPSPLGPLERDSTVRLPRLPEPPPDTSAPPTPPAPPSGEPPAPPSAPPAGTGTDESTPAPTPNGAPSWAQTLGEAFVLTAPFWATVFFTTVILDGQYIGSPRMGRNR